METRKNLMDLHRRLIRIGEYQVAKEVLRLLMHGSIVLGLSDTDWKAQWLGEDFFQNCTSWTCRGRS